MANVNQPRGMEPARGVGGYIPTNRYRVLATNATAIFIGDPVVRAAAGTVDLVTAGAGNPILGAVVEIIAPPASAFLYPYVPATCGSGWEVIVADDPQQEFIMQEDGDTSDLALTDEGSGIEPIAGTGSTITGLSGWQLDSSSAAVAANKQLRIIRMLQDPQNAIGDYCRWIVKINNHQALQGIVGVTI